MKKILLALSFALCSNSAFGYVLTKVESRTLAQLYQGTKPENRQNLSYCDNGDCLVLSYSENAPYGSQFQLILPPNRANNLVQNLKATGFEMPDPVFVWEVNQGDFAHLMGTSDPIQPPLDGLGVETDNDIGWNLLYCAAAIAGCASPGLEALKTTGVFMGMVSSCFGATEKCRDFLNGWEKERKYYEELQKYYQSKGYGPSKNVNGGRGSSSASTGASSGISGLPVGFGLGGSLDEGAEVPCDACVITEW